ncbi:MAG: PAS domain S-box protein, partial [Acidobacteria bacterium]|nr:PAS domain S-box protein [Acidobacteriota bacterium]
MSAEQVRPEVRSQPEQADFRSLAETLSSLIALIQDGKLVYVNKAACALLGREKEHAIGRHFYEVIHPDDREAAIARAQARMAGIPQPKRLIERLVHADGHAIWMDYSIDLIQFDGQPTILVTGYDVTERMKAEESLRKSQANLAEAQRIAQVGSWEWDMSTNRCTWSEELYRILGLDPSRVEPTYELYVSRLHPDDRRTVPPKDLGCDYSPFECEQRMIRDDGEVRTLWTTGRVDVDAGGRPVRMYGAVQDITDRRRAQEAHRQSEERFRLTFTHAAIGKVIIAPDRRLLEVNPAACRMLGYSAAELQALKTADVTHPDDAAKTEQLVRRLLEGAEVSAAVEKRFRRKDGHIVWALLTATLVRDPAGKPLYFIAEIEDITERKRAEQALKESEE